MKAAVVREHGGPDRLTYETGFPDPKPGEGDVIVAVKASSLNYHDVFTRRGMPGIKVPMPVIIGLDMAGEITQVGGGVSGWKVGDRVLVNPLNKKKGLMGEMLDGGMAEYCLVSADQLVAMPADVSFAEAASLPVAYGTAHRMLITHNTIKKGDRVLVLGASGGGVHNLEVAAAGGLPLVAPPVKYCTDNAAMIAWAGIERLRLGLSDGLDFAPRPRWPLDPTAKPGARA